MLFPHWELKYSVFSLSYSKVIIELVTLVITLDDIVILLSGFTDGEPWVQISYNYETSNVVYQNEASQSSLKVYKSLVEARDSPSIMFGVTDINSTANGTVFTFARYD